MFTKLSKKLGLLAKAGTTLITEDDLRNLYTDAPQSWSQQFPHVPPPDSQLSLTILSARWESYSLHAENMPDIAAQLLETGIDTPAIRRLAAELDIATRADAEPLVAQMFRDLSVRYPLLPNEAELIESRQIAREVIAGLRNPWAAASHLEIVIWGWIPGNAEMEEIFMLLDETEWTETVRRPLPIIQRQLLEVFSRLAMIVI